MTRLSLTSYEAWALHGPLNLSDGHARQTPTPEQAAILEQLGPLFSGVRKSPFSQIETAAHESFFGALGQAMAPVGTGHVLSCYSSSVAMDIFARSLRARTSRVGLIHPTFDNIPDLLKAWGHVLVPVQEAAVDTRDPSVFDRDIGCLFLTVPNNPSGWVVAPETMRWLAEECRSREIVLGLDTSFRGFDTRMWYDTYEILQAAGVEYVVIEDSGKLWPLQELKAGFLVCGTDGLPLKEAFEDLLLSISPVALELIRLFSIDAARGGFGRLHDMIRRHRLLVSEILGTFHSSPPDPQSRVCVERVLLPNAIRATAAYRALVERHVHLLPCESFHWADPGDGARFIRLSLARDTEVIERALPVILRYLQETAGHALTAS